MKNTNALRVKEADFEEVTEVKPDSKNRIYLGKLVEKNPSNTLYRVYRNSTGQIILDPQVTIPASEAWIYKNKKVLRAIDSGLKDAAAGKVRKAKEDYSKYVTDDEG